MERSRASSQQPDRPRGAGTRVAAVVGVGVVVSVVVGLVVGWVVGDVARGLGDVFLWGMIATAVVGVLVAVQGDRSYRSR